ncbi:membrane fusion protein, multidrug efflux system [Faunimonas pinastri]|uniref:Membrane fusion protein, multidrug efflux system n=1 Tax=Faunimonas pinastri TaxID=1855383 RepID=A0A1H9K823_9HYPH|nr:HlyD family secretion protein [Faunimonas pinastri]SEQ95376.1 membrane fusion protein, multidrug efflux system [Faunimonas pinastri]
MAERRSDEDKQADNEPDAREDDRRGTDGSHDGESREEKSPGDNGSDKTEEKGEEKKKRSALKNPIVRIIILIIVVLLLVAGGMYAYHWWTAGRFVQSTNDAYIHSDQVTVAPKVSGYVEEVFAGQNQPVDANQKLVKIDDRQYRARVAQAVASVDARKADIARADAQMKQQESQIEQARAQLAGSQSTAKFAADEVNRYRPLAATGAATAEQLAQLRNRSDQANAQVASNQAQLDSAITMVDSIKAQRQQAVAALEQAQAQKLQADLDLADTLVTTPISGRVGDRSVEVGQLVQPGLRMMTIVPVQELYIDANFKETQIDLMRVGQPATIEVDALSHMTLHGKVVSISPGTGAQFSLIPPENATGNFTKIVQRVPVRISIDAGPEARKVLVPGLSVNVDVDTISARSDVRRQKRESERAEDRADEDDE